MRIINPANGNIITTIMEDDAQSINDKFERAHAAQREWAMTSLSNRMACIERFNALLLEEAEALALDLTAEVGKPLAQARGEVRGGHGRSKWMVENASKYLNEEWMVKSGDTREKIVYEPLGVIANISAWNYPILVGINVFIPALLGGNAVLYKPSEFSTLTGMNLVRLLHRAGVPADVMQLVAGGRMAGESLLNLPLDGYFFTGSYATGRYIAERVATKLVPVGLELGGKDPMYVCDDVDVNSAAVAAVEGAFYNAGQSCCAVERIYVHARIYEPFVKAFIAEAAKWSIGDPMDEHTAIGPLTRPQQLDLLKKQVEDAVGKGAILIMGGQRAERQGYYFEPTVLANCDHSMSVMVEESFGPIIGIQPVADDDEAIELMLDTDYGLTSAVYSSNEQRAMDIMYAMNSGTVYWNCCDRVSPALPWSGRGHSGLGSTLSHQGLRAFVQPKSFHLRG
jgi:acyl-CoA reductase-like NAD-dependent aldehyde dehydrogenase